MISKNQFLFILIYSFKMTLHRKVTSTLAGHFLLKIGYFDQGMLFLLFYQNKLFLLKSHQGIFIQFRFLNHLFSSILDGSVVSS